MKACSKCGVEQDDVEFVWEDASSSGVSRRCNACRRTPVTDEERMLARREHGLIESRYQVNPHALLRYWQRVRPEPGVPRQVILREMVDLMAEAPWSSEPPNWFVSRGKGDAIYGRGYLHVAPGIVFCLADYHARGERVSTVLVQWPYPVPAPEDEPLWVQTIRRQTREKIERVRLRKGYERAKQSLDDR